MLQWKHARLVALLVSLGAIAVAGGNLGWLGRLLNLGW